MPVPCSGAFGTAINGSLEAPIDPTLADPLCRFVYIDAGANIGLQIEKLYDPALHSGSLMQATFRRHFGNDTGSRSTVCAYAIEPNPHHATRLSLLDARYPRLRVIQAAASVMSGAAAFYTNPGFLNGSAHHEWSASLQRITVRGKQQRYNVSLIDLSNFVLRHTPRRRQPRNTRWAGYEPDGAAVVMKLDIERAEQSGESTRTGCIAVPARMYHQSARIARAAVGGMQWQLLAPLTVAFPKRSCTRLTETCICDTSVRSAAASGEDQCSLPSRRNFR